jgi:acetyltransferase EpsM
MLIQRLVILGTRTLAIEVADLISEIPSYKVEAFVENVDREKTREKIEGIPILWIDEIAQLVHSHQAICALATTHRSHFVHQATTMGMSFTTIIHPSALLSLTARLGQGSIIARGANIGSHCGIGQHVLVGRGVLVGHHTNIADFVTVQMGANIAGACKIGHATYIGMSATVIDHISIGEHSVIGAGAVVTENIPSRVLAVGVPARIIKENIDGK